MFFSYSELSGAFLLQPSLFGTIANKIASHPSLFWGANLDSPNIIDLLKPSTIGNRPSQPRWLVILPGKEYDILAEEYSAEGFRIIRATTSELLSYFDSWETQPKEPEKQIDYSELFPHNYLPAILQRKHPVRPLSHFYQGADPSWNDIINNNLVMTSYYSTTLETILNNGKTLVTGSPGCGKTTLLMQLAISPDISGTKFFFSDIQSSQAEFLKQKISNDPHVTIFIDDISDSIDAYRILNMLPNVTLVIGDRDLKYETVRHILDMTTNRIKDVSDLNPVDIQKICDSMGRPTQTFSSGKVSLFEICYQLWAGKILVTRIKELISQINKIDTELMEFYTLLTYVRYCGIAASMDMLFNYYAGNPKFDYHQIYKWVDTIYSMVDDSGYPEDTLQDFFTLRSVIFSEVSLKYLPDEILRRVISQFHKNVNRGIIPRFDNFRRKAYDADITKKAFPDIKDGKEFYGSVIKADPSPFIKHQYALYFWRKGQREDAWTQIDLAYTQTRGSVYSINNTHAYILFANNIDKSLDADGIVLKTLDQTFEVLNNCLTMDTRTSYHVMTYSNNAIRYFKRFRDVKGLDYLKKANQCIDEELKRKDYVPARIHHQLIILKKVIKSLLKL